MEKSDVVIRFVGKDKINFKELEENLPFYFDKHKKGDVLYKRHIVANDVAILRYQKQKYLNTTEEKIKELIGLLYPYKSYLKKISNHCDVTLRIYLESNMAQMYFYIPQGLVTEISKLSLGIEISIYSEGLVEG